MSHRKYNVSYEKPHEPSFLKEFKQRIGYQEPPTIDSKRAMIRIDDDNDDEQEDREDERPTVVLQKQDDLTEAEAKIILSQQKVHNEKVDECKRIIFKKPVKRRECSELSVCSKKQKSDNTKSKQSTMEKVKNSSLLSFGNDEEDSEDDEEES